MMRIYDISFRWIKEVNFFLLLLFYLLINLVHLGLYQSYFSLRRRKRRRRRSNMRLLKFPIFRLVVTIKLGFLSEELAIAHSETYLYSSIHFIITSVWSKGKTVETKIVIFCHPSSNETSSYDFIIWIGI